MKDKTAVEWLEEKITKNDCGDLPMYIYNFIEQAQEMEKQQIIDAFKTGECDGTFEIINAEQYYNETFKK